MELGSNVLQLSGRAELDQPLELSHDYNIMIRCGCVAIQKVDNHDNTFNFIYKIKPSGIVGLVDDQGVANYAKVKGSPSSRWRWEVEKIDDYTTIMETMLNHPEEVCEFVISLRQKYGK